MEHCRSREMVEGILGVLRLYQLHQRHLTIIKSHISRNWVQYLRLREFTFKIDFGGLLIGFFPSVLVHYLNYFLLLRRYS